MRQMFSSPRLENVEGVNKLFNDAGIETKITQGRSYKGNSRREHSYTDKKRQADSSQYPAVWVLKAEDYTKAREILHDADLLEDKIQNPYFPGLQFKDQDQITPEKKMLRMKLTLLAIIGAMTFAMVIRALLF
ncbi:MAG TPA: pathogenicity-like protein [Arenimonas sp.]|nr:pathogenicity-like protein [Arenimonas sp.]HOZ04961.1 pathogenicity-like protein [Arenimonas sp.]HPW32233.1 pathogenicity-like protein [Arenimonas sp.]